MRTLYDYLSAIPIACLLVLGAPLPVLAKSTMEDLFENVSLCGEGGIEEARKSAKAHANSTGENLGHHSIGLEKQTFISDYTPPEFPEGMRGYYVYGLAIFSDDGCELSVNGEKVHKRYGKGQALPNLKKSFYDLPVLLQPGKPVKIELKYSNTHFITRGGFADIDGVTLYLYKVRAGIIPDYNRDGVIDDEDRGQVTEDNPWRWWVNDDDDKKGSRGAYDGSGDTPTGRFGNASGFDVDGVRDLVDFFPLAFDLKEVLERFPADSHKYRLTHEDGALHCAEVPSANPHAGKGAASHLLSVKVANSLARAKAHSTRRWGGHVMTGEMMAALKQGKGMILCEGVLNNDQPLILEIENDKGDAVFELCFPILISRVEQMYRHLNLRDELPKGFDGKPGELLDNLVDPGMPYPDELTNDTYFVHVHGFANDSKYARGGHAELFKRLHQMGSRARFVGVSWPGDTEPNYHKAVHRAFLSGDLLAGRLPKDGDIVIAGHSLGNIVASQAIEHGGLKAKNYFMINAASPIEAYDPTQTVGVDGKDMQVFMTEKSWEDFLPHRDKLFAADWHGLFPANDGRRKLTWSGLFAQKVPLVATNFYSTGEDVVQNPDQMLSASAHVVNRIRDFNFSEQSWVAQEVTKGSDILGRVIVPGTHAGWDFNTRDKLWKAIKEQDNWLLHINRLVSEAFVQQHPFHEPFKFDGLYDPAKGSALAKEKYVQYELLATAIPAMSYAVAANPVNAFGETGGNFNMMGMKTGDQWPRRDKDANWLHSDFRNVALCYVHQMYEKMINLGGLDQ